MLQLNVNEWVTESCKDHLFQSNHFLEETSFLLISYCGGSQLTNRKQHSKIQQTHNEAKTSLHACAVINVLTKLQYVVSESRKIPSDNLCVKKRKKN